MGIRGRQLQNEAKKILQKELSEGRYPDLSVVQQMVTERFQHRIAGLPRFQLKAVSNKAVSNAEDYNDMIKNLHEDLLTSFEEVRHQGDRMMALADYYETEKFRINLATKKLNRRMELLQDKLENRGLRDVVFDTFNDFVGVDFNGNKKRNIPATNAFIDLRHGWVGLDEIKAGSKKVNLATAHAVVKPISSFDDFVQLSSIDNCLKDTINESWRHRAVMAEPKAAEISYKIELEEEQEINIISFTPQSARPTTIVLRTSRDGENYYEHLPKEVSSLTEWNFDASVIKFIEFQMTKMEPDFAQGAEYHYYFGAQNISAKSVLFTQEGYLISQSHTIDRVIDKLQLNVDEVIPAGTKIEYFMAEDKLNDSILEWETIRPNKTMLFHGLEEKQVLVDSSSPLYGTFYDSLYNHDYYSIMKLEHTPAPRTVNILVGEGMYQVDSMDFTSDATFIPTLDSWKGAKEYTTSFIALNDAASPNEMPVQTEKLERMTVHITMAKDYTLYANALSKKEDMKVSVYLNNMEIKPINQAYTYKFKAGVNKLEIIYYAPTGGAIAPNLEKTYLESIGATDIYAKSDGLKEVDLYDLMNNTSKKDYTKFAIDKNNTVILNYDPKAFDKTGQGVRFKLTYRYPSDATQTQTHIRFMAKLSRETSKGDVSPILKSYKFIIE